MDYNNAVKEVNTTKYYDIPICFVDGILSPKSMDVFSNFIIHLKENLKSKNLACPLMLKSEGGMGGASAYDNAVDLFYQIVGGKVDYNEIHAKKHGHSRYGKFYSEGKYEIWSEKNPINFVTHSFGGNVVLLLQNLLELQVFYDESGNKFNTNSRWIRSLTTISSPLRGSLTNYHFGHHPYKPRLLTPFTFKWVMHICCYIVEYIGSPTLTEYLMLDFKVNHFNMSYKHVSLTELVTNLVSNLSFSCGTDIAFNDTSMERYLTRGMKHFETSYYRSYAATMTEIGSQNTDSEEKCLVSIQHPNLFLVNWATLTANTDIESIYPSIPKHEYLGWKSTDGMCSLISQYHPNSCRTTACKHIGLNQLKHQDESLKAGVWYTTTLTNCSHADIVPGYLPPQTLSNWILKLINMCTLTKISNSNTFWDRSYLKNLLTRTVDDYTDFLLNTGVV